MAETHTQDAIALLKEDHRKVEELFSQFEKAKGDGRKQKLAQQICMELSVHATLEEEIFYPACAGAVEEDLIKESLVEHDGAKVLISEILAADGADDEFFEAKVKVLQEQIEHHIEEEEGGTQSLFSQARKGDIDLKAVGREMAQRKAELTAQFEASGIPQPGLTTMPGVQL